MPTKQNIYTAGTAALSSVIVPEGPRDLISVDFCGPYPTGQGGMRYLLVVLDTFTKFVVIYPLTKASAKITIKSLFEDYIPTYGRPIRIQSDHGTPFTSRLWIETTRAEQIRAVFSTVRHPQSNLVERVNKEIGRYFRALNLKKYSSWPTWIPFIQNSLNESYHDTTQFTPMELQTGKKPTRFWNNWLTLPDRVDLPYAEKIALVYARIKSKGENPC